jgi:hypothetical protein
MKHDKISTKWLTGQILHVSMKKIGTYWLENVLENNRVLERDRNKVVKELARRKNRPNEKYGSLAA